MEQTKVKTRKKIVAPKLPLAVYRELAAHLRQIEGVQVEIIADLQLQFDYHQSQVSGLGIKYAPSLDSSKPEQQVEEILKHYGIFEEIQTTICAQDDPALE